MPCELKHIEAIRSALGDREASNAGYVAAVGMAITAALSACDESPCVWGPYRDTGMMKPSCCVFKWMPEESEAMTYCPHCGRKIAPLPAAPEVG